MTMSNTTNAGSLPKLPPKVQITFLAVTLLSAAIHNFLAVFVVAILLLLAVSRTYPLAYVERPVKYIAITPVYAFFHALIFLNTNLLIRIEEFIKLSFLPMIVLLITNCSKRSILWFFYVFAFVMIVTFAAYTVVGAFSVVDFLGNRRFSGIFPHANHCGYAISAAMLFLFRVYIKRSSDSMMPVVLLLLLIPPFLATRSSGALMMTGIVLFLILFTDRISVSYRFFGVLILSVFMVVLPFLDISSAAIDKFIYFDFDVAVDRAEQLSFGNQGSSIGWRVSYWLAILDQYFQGSYFNIFFGYGGGSTTKGNMAFDFMSHDPHNDLLGIIVEYGTAGLIVFLFATYKYCAGTENRWISMAIILSPMLAGNSLGSLVVMSVILPSVEFFRVKNA